MNNEIIGQALSILAMLLFALSYQARSNSRLLIIQTFATLSICLSYLFLGATTGFAINVVCILRNLIFYFIKPRTRTSYVCVGLLCTAMLALGIIFWQGPISLLVTLPLIVNTVFMSFGDPQLLRFSVIGTSSTLLLYNAIIPVPSLGGIVSESLSVISSIVGILRFKGKSTTENIEN